MQYTPQHPLSRWPTPLAAHLSTTARGAKHQHLRSGKDDLSTRQHKTILKAHDHEMGQQLAKLQRLDQRNLRDAAARERARERLQADLACSAARSRCYNAFSVCRNVSDTVFKTKYRTPKQLIERQRAEARFDVPAEQMLAALKEWWRAKMQSAIPTVFAPWRDEVGVLKRVGRVLSTLGCGVGLLLTVSWLRCTMALLRAVRWSDKWAGQSNRMS